MAKKNKQKELEELNPFLMIGSYIGLIIGGIFAYFSFTFIFYLAEEGKFTIFALLIPLGVIIFGFLFGWLIHTLILKLIYLNYQASDEKKLKDKIKEKEKSRGQNGDKEKQKVVEKKELAPEKKGKNMLLKNQKAEKKRGMKSGKE